MYPDPASFSVSQDGVGPGPGVQKSEATAQETSQTEAPSTIHAQAEDKHTPVDVSLASWERPAPSTEVNLEHTISECEAANDTCAAEQPAEPHQVVCYAEERCSSESCHVADLLQPIADADDDSSAHSQINLHTVQQETADTQRYPFQHASAPSLETAAPTELASGLSPAPRVTTQSQVHKPQHVSCDGESAQMSANGQSLELEVDSWDTRLLSTGARRTRSDSHNPEPHSCEHRAKAASNPASNRSSSMGVTYSICTSNQSAHGVEKTPYDHTQNSSIECQVHVSQQALYACNSIQASTDAAVGAVLEQMTSVPSGNLYEADVSRGLPGTEAQSNRGHKEGQNTSSVGVGDLQVSTIGTQQYES